MLLRTAHAQSPYYQFIRTGINEGLSNSQVNAIFSDSTGFMWFGTASGLNRYDGYNFLVFRHSLRDSTTLSDNFISDIMAGPGGKLWINTRRGFNIYDPVSNTFSRNISAALRQLGIPGDTAYRIFHDRNGAYWFLQPDSGLYKVDKGTTRYAPGQRILAMEQDKDGHYWLLHATGTLEKMDRRSKQIIYRHPEKINTGAPNCTLFADADGDLWISSISLANGLFHFNIKARTLTPINQFTPGLALNNNIVTGITQDNNGLIWVGTDHGGINIIDKKKNTIRYITHNSEDDKSLSQNSITALYKDSTGIIWTGTYKKGINYYHENIVKFPLYQHQSFSPNSLPFDDVNRFVEDEAGNIWIGTNGGGLIYFDRSRNTFKQYLHEPGNPNSLSANVIVSLWIDHEKKLWIGTYFGGLDCFDGQRFSHYRHHAADTASLADNNVWEIMEDRHHNLWVGTLNGGLDVLGPDRKSFTHLPVNSTYISALLEDHQGNLWIGTEQGLDVRDAQTGRMTHYGFDASNPASLSHNHVLCLFQDSRQRIWIGTREGLNRFDPATKSFRIYRQENGLPDNTVLNILEDNDHTLWMSTPNGICNMRDTLFKNYDASDGLQGKEFNENAALRTSKGELIFGGGNGFNLFLPHTIELNRNVPPVVLTDLQIFNKSIHPGEKVNGRVLLNAALSQTREIVLKYRENVFSIEFSALNYFHPEKNRYAYMLEGFNKEWLYTDGQQRKAIFTNLNAGDYTFRVKASNNDGVWNDTGLTLRIKVLPPFWKSPLAFVLYALLILGALLLARRIVLERERLKYRMAQEQQEAARMHELDNMKIRFFTNISHEFRTPLSLIITPLEKIVKTASDAGLKSQLELIQRNARRLLNLVNQLLDFRKMEVQEIRLHLNEGDIIAYLRELAYSFSDLSEKKHIRLSFSSQVKELKMQYDADKIEKIMFNLLSNAFKFTPEDGQISVDVALIESGLEIQVKDTGIGIPLEKQEHIFERFFQHDMPSSMVNPGSGIGLSITREFVKLHGGSITVDSAPEMGSCFTITLPVSGEAVPGLVQEEIKAAHAKTQPAISGTKGKKPVLLLVEDNEDFRFYLKDNLGLYFHILEAENGVTGWNILAQTVPDVIVSDVAMPEMDGLELCRKVRSNQRTAHIPVILLTARAAEHEQLEALEQGASDYITKPFNFEVLLSRIRNTIAGQASLRKSYEKHIEVHPEEIAISSADEQFIQQAMQIVEKNISNAGFSVEELSRALFMSRVSVYKKILALTGKTPIEFIRTMRLKRAAQLLEKSKMTVAEVAYETGFNNPKYFTKYFKMEFNMLPSAYAASRKSDS
ncbi:hybrid sensor histidine kinase/response regulator [Chitinophaga cymbidii]|uniref:histidine kinase n=1 Tax=Chitinophaga cymbidii TaxID=1096750 RepID=A0A512RTC2_9BACT|nr:hybrid sensor histidine kinase/response regulator [Chitinophaga cymbidii]